MIKHNAKRNNRLHKKLRTGLFQELCFSIQFQFPSDWTDNTLDEFFQFIESIELGFAGSTTTSHVIGCIAHQSRGTVSPEQYKTIVDWLENRGCSVNAGVLEDAWY